MSQKSKAPNVIISLLSAPKTKLGGQEIRWGRLTMYLLAHADVNLHVVVNSSLWQCLNEIGIHLNGPRVLIVEDHPTKFIRNLKAQWALWKAARRGSIIHVPAVGLQTIYTALLCKRLKASRVIYSYTTVTFRRLLEKSVNVRGFKIIERIAKRVDLFEVINPQLDWQGIVPEEKLRISPCSFSDPERFMPSLQKRAKVVFAGHLSTMKGVHLLISILKAWPTDDTTEFLICGDANGTESSIRAEQILDQLCSARPNWRRARFNDISNEISNARVFLSLQEVSNYPSQSLLEAMLCGCCVVATNTGETDLLVKSPFGVTIDPESPVMDFVHATQRYLQMSSPEFDACSKAARNFVCENHSIERYANHILGLWEELTPSIPLKLSEI